MTTNFCVVGSPIDHSLSPILHLSVYKHLGLDFEYEKREVKAGELADFLAGADYRGVSVTMPLKNEAFSLATTRDGFSELTEVANTLVRQGDHWHAANTDVAGLIGALGEVPKPKSISIIGSGATTYSALVAISRLFPNSQVSLLARNQDELAKLVSFGESLGLAVTADTPNPARLAKSDLVLNLVPQGSYEQIWQEIADLVEKPKGWLLDVSYNPWPSRAALSWGMERTISGIEMLIWQAIEQIELFMESSGQDSKLDRSQMYSLMKQAVSGKKTAIQG